MEAVERGEQVRNRAKSGGQWCRLHGGGAYSDEIVVRFHESK